MRRSSKNDIGGLKRSLTAVTDFLRGLMREIFQNAFRVSHTTQDVLRDTEGLGYVWGEDQSH